MSKPQFTAAENFRCIEMDKSTIYIVVEGLEVDVFESVLLELTNRKHSMTPGFVVVSGSNKNTILDYCKNSTSKNFFAILDKDFDFDTKSNSRLSLLSRYSIENYYFDHCVVKRVLARVLEKSTSSIDIDMNGLINHYQENLSEILPWIIAYQKGDIKPFAWADKSILKKDCWKVDGAATADLFERIKLATHQAANLKSHIFLIDFPGKLIAPGLYFYIKNELKIKNMTRVYSNYKAFMSAILSALSNSADFCRDLNGAKDFILNHGKQ